MSVPEKTYFSLAYKTAFGRFTIHPVQEQPHLCKLDIGDDELGVLTLGVYCSINDAILAVTQQQTSYKKWDDLCLNEVPYNVFDITCWDFKIFSGTNFEQSCS